MKKWDWTLPQTWDDMLAEIDRYIDALLVINDARERRVWQYVIGLAAELEFLAVAVLWVADGKPGTQEQYREKMTLGQAAVAIKDRGGLLDDETIRTLEETARVRNSVGHRAMLYGVAVQDGKRGMYKGLHVFTDLGGLKLLAGDVDRAVMSMYQWLDKHDPTPTR